MSYRLRIETQASTQGGWAWPPAARSWTHSQAEDAGPQFVLEPGRLQHVPDEL